VTTPKGSRGSDRRLSEDRIVLICRIFSLRLINLIKRWLSGRRRAPKTAAENRPGLLTHVEVRLRFGQPPDRGRHSSGVVCPDRMPIIFLRMQNGGGRVSADEPAGQRRNARDVFPRELTARKIWYRAVARTDAQKVFTPTRVTA
jgi:hypothetical protein